MPSEHYLEDVLVQLHKYKELAEKAIAQAPDKDFFRLLDNESNSIALIMKHMAGNMRSRWTDFITSDGEKSDRHRDTEFEIENGDTRASIMQRWEAGWQYVFEAIEPLKAEDLSRTVLIRSEPHSVVQAINRQLTHYAYHIGQIVFLARHFAGEGWKSLSIPKDKSEEFNVTKMGRAEPHKEK